MQNIHTTTRRSALVGIAAGALAATAGTAMAAADHPDAELLELERQIEALMEPLAKAGDAIEECAERFRAMAPRQPASLWYSVEDRAAGLHPPETVSGDTWCGWAIDERLAVVPAGTDAERRLRELKAIHDGWWEAVKHAAQVSGHDPAIEEQNKVWDMIEAIQKRAREIEPQTFEGLAVKARLVAFEAWHTLFSEPEPDMDWEPKVLRAFVEQAMRLGGRDLLPTPWRVS